MDQEYFSSKEYNRINENKPFKAEMYLNAKEFLKTPKEELDTPEENSLRATRYINKDKVKDKDKEGKLKNDILKRLTTSTAATTGTVAAATAAVVASATVLSGVVVAPPKLNLAEITSGADYVYYSLEGEQFDKDTNYTAIIYGEGKEEKYTYNLSKGVNNQLIGGLLPSKDYVFEVVGDNINQGKVTYLEKKFKTANKDKMSAYIKFTELDYLPEQTEQPEISPVSFYENTNGNLENDEGEKKKYLEYEIYVSDLMKKGSEYYYEVKLYDEVYHRGKLNPGINKSPFPLVIEGDFDFEVYAMVEGKAVSLESKTFDDGKDIIIPTVAPPSLNLKEIETSATALYYSLDVDNLNEQMAYNLKIWGDEYTIVHQRPLKNGNIKEIVKGIAPSHQFKLTVSGRIGKFPEITYFERVIDTKQKDEASAVIKLDVEKYNAPNPVAQTGESGDNQPIDGLNYEIYLDKGQNLQCNYIVEVSCLGNVIYGDELSEGINQSREIIPISGDMEVVVIEIDEQGLEKEISKKAYISGIKPPVIEAPVITKENLESNSTGIYYSYFVDNLSPGMMYELVVEDENGNHITSSPINGEGRYHEIIKDLNVSSDYFITIFGNSLKTGKIEYVKDKITTKNANEITALIKLDEVEIPPPERDPSDTSGDPGLPQRGMNYEIYVSDVNNNGTDKKFKVTLYNSPVFEDLINGNSYISTEPIVVKGDLKVEVFYTNEIHHEVSAGYKMFVSGIEKPVISAPTITFDEPEMASDALYYSFNIDNLSQEMYYSLEILDESGVYVNGYEIPYADHYHEIVQGLTPSKTYTIRITGEHNLLGIQEYYTKTVATKNANEITALIKFDEVMIPPPDRPSWDTSGDPGLSTPGIDYEIYISDPSNIGTDKKVVVSISGAPWKEQALNENSYYSSESIPITGDVAVEVFYTDGNNHQVSMGKKIYKNKADKPEVM